MRISVIFLKIAWLILEAMMLPITTPITMLGTSHIVLMMTPLVIIPPMKNIPRVKIFRITA